MTIYYFLILLLLISLLPKKGSRLSRILYLLDAIVVFLVIATRDYSVGNDTEAYVAVGLEEVLISEVKSQIEILWSLFIELYQKTSLGPEGFIYITAILEFTTIFIFIYKESANRVLSLLLFVILVTGLCFYMTGIRQAISLGFVLFAFYFLKRKKYFLCALFLLIGVGFHTVSVAALLFIPFTFINFRKAVAVTLVVISALLGLLLKSNVFSVYSNISDLLTFLQMYSSYSEQVIQVPNIVGLLAIILPSTIIAIMAILYTGEHVYMKIFVAGVIFVNLFVSTPFIERYFMYATMLQIILVPEIYKRGTSQVKIIMAVCVFMLAILFLNSIPYSTGTDNYISTWF